MSAPKSGWGKQPQRQGYSGGPAAANSNNDQVPIWARPAPAAPQQGGKQPQQGNSKQPPHQQGGGKQPPHQQGAKQPPHQQGAKQPQQGGGGKHVPQAPSGGAGGAATPFFGSFVGVCTQCKKETQVARQKDHGEDQYCKGCWNSWWSDKDRQERGALMGKERDALRARSKDVTLWNAVPAKVTPQKTLSYPIVIEKSENMSEGIRKKLIVNYLREIIPKEHFSAILGTLLISGATLYTRTDLSKVVEEPLLRTVRAGALEASVQLLVGEVGEVVMDLNNRATQEIALQYFNVLLGSCMQKAGLERHGPIYVESKGAKVYNDMVVIPGFFAALQMVNKVPVLMVHPRTRVQSTATALDWINRRQERDMLGEEVISTYGNRKRSYRVYAIDRNSSPSTTFELKTGQTITFAQYYKEQYGVTIRDMAQPLLWADKDGRIKLVPELMLVDSLPQEAKRTLPTRCSRLPTPFAAECADFIARIQRGDVVSYLNDHGVSFGGELQQKTPREMKPVMITLSGGQKMRPYSDFAPQTMSIRASCERRDVVVMAWGDASLDVAKEIVSINEQIKGSWKQTGDIKHVKGSEDDNDFVNKCIAALPAAPAKAASPQLPNVLVICTLKNGHSARGERAYASLKFALGRAGVVSHFVDYSKLRSTSSPQPYVHNITKNITTKMGNPLWTTNLMEVVPELKGGTLFVGYDVYHDKRSESSSTGVLEVQRRSIAGFVAWYLRADNTWHHYAEVDLHVSRQELLNKAKDASATAAPAAAAAAGRCTIDEFIKAVYANIIKDSKCARVVVYRDGVGDSQLTAVKDSELPQIKAALPPKTELCFLVVQKRIHDRYVMKTTGAGAKPTDYHNIPRGFSLDYAPATFLQVAVDCTLSTSKPVKYVCMCSGGMTPDGIQQMTWGLCWLYANWPGSIKVPFVLQCAHKLAYFHGASHENSPSVHPALKKMPYYL